MSEMPEPESAKPILLFFPFGYLSHYLRCIVLARQFSGRFQIMFAGHRSYSAFVAQEGFTLFDCDAIDEKHVLQKLKKFDFSWLQEQVLERVFLDQLNAINKYRPVAVIGDATPTLKMAAEKAGVTYISLLNGYMSSHYALPRHLSRTHPVYTYLSVFPQAIRKAFTSKGEAFKFRRIHTPFKKLRKRYTLRPQKNYLSEMEGDFNLICDLDHLFPQKRLPDNYSMLSPLIYNETEAAPVTISQQLDKNKKTLLVSMGSTGNWAAMAFLNFPYFRKYNVVAVGDRENILYDRHIIKADFLSLQTILPDTDLMICHGGNGTIYQALSHGIPVLCKTAHFEQEWNIQAVERKGLGASLDGVVTIFEFINHISFWIDKKGSPVFNDIADKIKYSVQTGATNVQQVSDIISRKQTVDF